MEVNLAQQLDGLAHNPIFQCFIDVRKAYNSLDRGQCIEVLRGYGMGLNLARLFKSYWDHHRIFPNMGKFLRKDFRTGRKVTQGEPELSMIFNIVVNAVVWAVLDVVCGPQEAQHGLGWAAGERNLVFTMKMEG